MKTCRYFLLVWFLIFTVFSATGCIGTALMAVDAAVSKAVEGGIESAKSERGPGVIPADLQKIRNLGFLMGSDLIGKDDVGDIAVAETFGAKLAAAMKEYGYPVTDRTEIERKMKVMPQNGSDIDRMIAAGRELGLHAIVTGKITTENLKVKTVVLNFWGMEDGKRLLSTLSVKYRDPGAPIENAAKAAAKIIKG